MLLFSTISFVICFIYLYLSRNARNTAIIYLALLTTGWLFIYKIPIFILFNAVSMSKILAIIFVCIFVYMLDVILSNYEKMEIGRDISELLIDLFPDNRLRIFGFLFLTQFIPSQYILVLIVVMYYLGRNLRLDNITIVIISMLSITLNVIVDNVHKLYLYPDLKVDSLVELEKFNSLAILILYIIVFIAVTVAIIFEQSHDTSVKDVIVEDFKQLLSIIGLFTIVYIFMVSVFELNFALKLISIIMFFFISYLSRRYMENAHVERVEHAKKYPYIFSIGIYVVNFLIIFLFNKYLFMGFVSLLIFNYMMFKIYTKTKLVVEFKSELLLSLLFITIGVIITGPVFELSNINNANFGYSVYDVVNTSLQNSVNPFSIFVKMIGYTNMLYLGDYSLLVNNTIPNIYYVSGFYFYYLLMPLNFLVLYFVKSLVDLEDEQYDNVLITLFAVALIASQVIIMTLYIK